MIARKPPVWGFGHSNLPPGPAMLLRTLPSLLHCSYSLSGDQCSSCPEACWQHGGLPLGLPPSRKGTRKGRAGCLTEEQSVLPGQCARGCCGGDAKRPPGMSHWGHWPSVGSCDAPAASQAAPAAGASGAHDTASIWGRAGRLRAIWLSSPLPGAGQRSALPGTCRPGAWGSLWGGPGEKVSVSRGRWSTKQRPSPFVG